MSEPLDAIIIVDLQAEFEPPAELIERIAVRAEAFPRRIFTQFVNVPGSLFRRKLGQKSCTRESSGARLVLPPRDGDLVFQKEGYGLNAEQIEALRVAGVKRPLVCGIDTDACVLAVMFSLWDARINGEVDPELCWSSSDLHAEALKIMQEQFGTGDAPGIAVREAPAGRSG